MEVSALFIHPQLSERQQFKQMAIQLGLFESLTLETRLGDGLERLRGSKPYQLIYVSNNYDKHLSGEWIKTARISPQGKASAYVAVVKGDSTGRSNDPSGSPIEGADLVLTEPYNKELFQQTVTCGKRVFQERKRIIDLQSMKQLTKNLPSLVDMRVDALLARKEAPTALQMLKDNQKKVSSLAPEMQAAFFEYLIDAFIAAPLPHVEDTKNPFGVPRQAVRIQKVVVRSRY